MKKFGTKDWKKYIPNIVFDEKKEYEEVYNKAWELAFDHIRSIPGMPQTPYMDEAFCDTQIWIWDSCFMSLFCKYASDVFPGVETFDNFYQPLYEGKDLPYIIPSEDEPWWTGAIAGEPYKIRVHIADNPPLFAWAEYENVLFSGDKERISRLLNEKQVLQKHYDFLENLKQPFSGDSVFIPTCWEAAKDGYRWEGGRSGMDNTPRGRTGASATEERPDNRNALWVDAICQQAMAANMIAKLYGILNDDENQQLWKAKYEEKKKTVNDFYWDDKDEFYYDIDCDTHDFYRVMTVASYWTMTSEIATEDRAKALVKQALNPETLGGDVPLLSLARNDCDYSPSGKYWRGALWLPTAYTALKGLINYGYFDVAHDAALKILNHMYKTYTEYAPHSIWECYSPEECKPSTQTDDTGVVRKDFCGWSALGPISIYIEFVLGFYYVNAFDKVIKWAKPSDTKGNIGIKNLKFGDIVTDIIANGNICRVISNGEYTLEINGEKYEINIGENEILI